MLPVMKFTRKTYNKVHLASAALMILALVWLTVSLPLVTRAQQSICAAQTALPGAEEDPGSENPFANTTEEKTESGSNTLSEYLHHTEMPSHLSNDGHRHHCMRPYPLYVAFHGETLGPPPDYPGSFIDQ